MVIRSFYLIVIRIELSLFITILMIFAGFHGQIPGILGEKAIAFVIGPDGEDTMCFLVAFSKEITVKAFLNTSKRIGLLAFLVSI
jgi:hypothetical protein